MREDDLITAVRVAGRLNDSDTDYTPARIRTELTKALNLHFGARIIEAESGYWIKRYDTPITSTKLRYRMPYRAAAIEDVQELSGTGSIVNQRDQLIYTIEGDQIVFKQPRTQTTLRQMYYLRPSTLVQFQTVGTVTAVSPSSLTVTVDAVPTNRVTSVAVASGDKVDIVHPNGWHELAVVGVAATLSATTFTFPAGTDLSDVENGDFVRAAEQTDWPALQDDFHELLADVTAAQILRSRGQRDKSEALMQRAMGTEQEPGPMRLFQDLIEPRVKTAREAVVPTVGVLRGRYRRRWPAAVP